MLEAQLAAISAELDQTRCVTQGWLVRCDCWGRMMQWRAWCAWGFACHVGTFASSTACAHQTACPPNRQESVVRLESMAAQVAAWRASAEGVAQQAEQARRELAERAAEIEGTLLKMRSLAELLAVPGSPTAPQDASLASLAGGSPGAGRLEGLQFHRGAPGGSGGGSGGKSKSKLPHLKTRAIPGASLRQPGGEGGSPGGSPGISALPSLSPGARGLQRERSTGGGVAWAASGKAADRSAESQRDYARTEHMARWNNA